MSQQEEHDYNSSGIRSGRKIAGERNDKDMGEGSGTEGKEKEEGERWVTWHPVMCW